MTVPVFRFAPSPNGELHLGHAYSALVNHSLAREAGGCFLLRIEDIDLARCTSAYEAGIYRDLVWLGLSWEEPVRRQSEHFSDYAEALGRLAEEELVYPAFMSRGEVRAHILDAEAAGEEWPRDPDGAPLYPPLDRQRAPAERHRLIASGAPFTWRLDTDAAIARIGTVPGWREEGMGPDGGTGTVGSDPRRWGDVVLARRDAPVSYHLAVVVDDALQGVTHVVRGRDLFHATAVHRLLQELLGLPVPIYLHHDLILGGDGRKLSKSRQDTAIAALREAGATPQDVKRMVGL